MTNARSASNVDVVVASDGAVLTGRVTGNRVAVAGATVVTFATRTSVTCNGLFTQNSLPPGEY